MHLTIPLCFIFLWLLAFALSKHPLLKQSLEVKPFIYLIYRTKLFNKAIKGLSQKFKRFWFIVLNLAVLIAVALMVYSLHFLTRNILSFLHAPEEAVAVVPILPIITIRLESLPYFLFAVAIISIVHEVAHGIAMYLENVEVKSTGFLVAVFLLGAFTEEDKEQLKRARLISKLRIYSIGSAANVVLAAFLFLMIINFSLLISPFYVPGVKVIQVLEGSPAYGASIQAQDVIYRINGTSLATYLDFSSYMEMTRPNDTLILDMIKADGSVKTVKLRTERHPDYAGRGFLGIRASSYNPPRHGWEWLPGSLPLHIQAGMIWTFLLSLFVAIFNMAPIYPLDGGHFVTSIVKRWRKDVANGVKIVISLVVLALLIANIALTFLKIGWIRL